MRYERPLFFGDGDVTADVKIMIAGCSALFPGGAHG